MAFKPLRQVKHTSSRKPSPSKRASALAASLLWKQGQHVTCGPLMQAQAVASLIGKTARLSSRASPVSGNLRCARGSQSGGGRAQGPLQAQGQVPGTYQGRGF